MIILPSNSRYIGIFTVTTYAKLFPMQLDEVTDKNKDSYLTIMACLRIKTWSHYLLGRNTTPGSKATWSTV